jgi:hypothetical protein
MKRTFATSALAVAVIGLAACKGGAGDAVKFVPEAATFIAGVDVAAVRSSKLWTDNKEKLESGGGEDLKKMEKCNLGIDKFSKVTIAGDGKGEGSIVAIVEGDGIGKKENLDCLAKEDEKFTVEEDGKVVKIGGGEMVGYVVSDGLVAFAGDDWAASVKELVDGKGKNAGDGALKDLIGRAPTSDAIWFAGNVPQEMAAMASGAGGTPKDVTGGINLSSGVAAKVAVTMSSEDEAKKMKETADAQIEGLKGGGAEALGVPKAVVESVKVETDGAMIKAEASISDADLKTLQDKLMGMM